MKIYVAAHFYDDDLVCEWYDALRNAGHEITHPWAELDGGTNEAMLSDDELRAAAVRDLNGVFNCQLLLWLAHDERMLGATFEAGYAYRRGVQIIVVDPYRRSVFHLLRGVQVMTHDEAMEELTGDTK